MASIISSSLQVFVSGIWYRNCSSHAGRRKTMPEKRKGMCAHPACQCPVEEGEKYCSQYCEDAADTTEISCNCEHAGCALAEAV
jgi:hypothetical protein